MTSLKSLNLAANPGSATVGTSFPPSTRNGVPAGQVVGAGTPTSKEAGRVNYRHRSTHSRHRNLERMRIEVVVMFTAIREHQHQPYSDELLEDLRRKTSDPRDCLRIHGKLASTCLSLKLNLRSILGN